MGRVKTLLETAEKISGGRPVGVYILELDGICHLATPDCETVKSGNVYREFALRPVLDKLCERCQDASTFAIQTEESHMLVEVERILEAFKRMDEILARMESLFEDPQADKQDCYRLATENEWLAAFYQRGGGDVSINIKANAEIRSDLEVEDYTVTDWGTGRTVLELLNCLPEAEAIMHDAASQMLDRSQNLPDQRLREWFASVVAERAPGHEPSSPLPERAFMKARKALERELLRDERRFLVAHRRSYEHRETEVLMRLYGEPLRAAGLPALVVNFFRGDFDHAVQKSSDPEVLETTWTLFGDAGKYAKLKRAHRAARDLK